MLVGMLEGRMSRVRGEGKTWEQEERAARGSHLLPGPRPQTFLDVTADSSAASRAAR